jgi:hypothetical protein
MVLRDKPFASREIFDMAIYFLDWLTSDDLAQSCGAAFEAAPAISNLEAK